MAVNTHGKHTRSLDVSKRTGSPSATSRAESENERGSSNETDSDMGHQESEETPETALEGSRPLTDDERALAQLVRLGVSAEQVEMTRKARQIPAIMQGVHGTRDKAIKELQEHVEQAISNERREKETLQKVYNSLITWLELHDLPPVPMSRFALYLFAYEIFISPEAQWDRSSRLAMLEMLEDLRLAANKVYLPYLSPYSSFVRSFSTSLMEGPEVKGLETVDTDLKAYEEYGENGKLVEDPEVVADAVPRSAGHSEESSAARNEDETATKHKRKRSQTVKSPSQGKKRRVQKEPTPARTPSPVDANNATAITDKSLAAALGTRKQGQKSPFIPLAVLGAATGARTASPAIRIIPLEPELWSNYPAPHVPAPQHSTSPMSIVPIVHHNTDSTPPPPEHSASIALPAKPKLSEAIEIINLVSDSSSDESDTLVRSLVAPTPAAATPLEKERPRPGDPLSVPETTSQQTEVTSKQATEIATAESTKRQPRPPLYPPWLRPPDALLDTRAAAVAQPATNGKVHPIPTATTSALERQVDDARSKGLSPRLAEKSTLQQTLDEPAKLNEDRAQETISKIPQTALESVIHNMEPAKAVQPMLGDLSGLTAHSADATKSNPHAEAAAMLAEADRFAAGVLAQHTTRKAYAPRNPLVNVQLASITTSMAGASQVSTTYRPVVNDEATESNQRQENAWKATIDQAAVSQQNAGSQPPASPPLPSFQQETWTGVVDELHRRKPVNKPARRKFWGSQSVSISPPIVAVSSTDGAQPNMDLWDAAFDDLEKIVLKALESSRPVGSFHETVDQAYVMSQQSNKRASATFSTERNSRRMARSGLIPFTAVSVPPTPESAVRGAEPAATPKERSLSVELVADGRLHPGLASYTLPNSATIHTNPGEAAGTRRDIPARASAPSHEPRPAQVNMNAMTSKPANFHLLKPIFPDFLQGLQKPTLVTGRWPVYIGPKNTQSAQPNTVLQAFAPVQPLPSVLQPVPVTSTISNKEPPVGELAKVTEQRQVENALETQEGAVEFPSASAPGATWLTFDGASQTFKKGSDGPDPPIFTPQYARGQQRPEAHGLSHLKSTSSGVLPVLPSAQGSSSTVKRTPSADRIPRLEPVYRELGPPVPMPAADRVNTPESYSGRPLLKQPSNTSRFTDVTSPEQPSQRPLMSVIVPSIANDSAPELSRFSASRPDALSSSTQGRIHAPSVLQQSQNAHNYSIQRSISESVERRTSSNPFGLSANGTATEHQHVPRASTANPLVNGHGQSQNATPHRVASRTSTGAPAQTAVHSRPGSATSASAATLHPSGQLLGSPGYGSTLPTQPRHSSSSASNHDQKSSNSSRPGNYRGYTPQQNAVQNSQWVLPGQNRASTLPLQSASAAQQRATLGAQQSNSIGHDRSRRKSQHVADATPIAVHPNRSQHHRVPGLPPQHGMTAEQQWMLLRELQVQQLQQSGQLQVEQAVPNYQYHTSSRLYQPQGSLDLGTEGTYRQQQHQPSQPINTNPHINAAHPGPQQVMHSGQGYQNRQNAAHSATANPQPNTVLQMALETLEDYAKAVGERDRMTLDGIVEVAEKMRVTGVPPYQIEYFQRGAIAYMDQKYRHTASRLQHEFLQQQQQLKAKEEELARKEAIINQQSQQQMQLFQQFQQNQNLILQQQQQQVNQRSTQLPQNEQVPHFSQPSTQPQAAAQQILNFWQSHTPQAGTVGQAGTLPLQSFQREHQSDPQMQPSYQRPGMGPARSQLQQLAMNPHLQQQQQQQQLLQQQLQQEQQQQLAAPGASQLPHDPPEASMFPRGDAQRGSHETSVLDAVYQKLAQASLKQAQEPTPPSALTQQTLPTPQASPPQSAYQLLQVSQRQRVSHQQLPQVSSVQHALQKRPQVSRHPQDIPALAQPVASQKAVPTTFSFQLPSQARPPLEPQQGQPQAQFSRASVLAAGSSSAINGLQTQVPSQTLVPDGTQSPQAPASADVPAQTLPQTHGSANAPERDVPRPVFPSQQQEESCEAGSASTATPRHGISQNQRPSAAISAQGVQPPLPDGSPPPTPPPPPPPSLP